MLLEKIKERLNISDKQWQELIRFIKFCVVGVSNTAISLGIYYIFIVFDPKLYIIGNIVGFVVSVLNSYFWNSRFVFKKTDEKAKTLFKTFAAYGSNLFISTAILYIFVDVIKISEFIAPLLGLLITVPLNYFINKNWAMK
ncbi:MAG: GtrA family protein [Ruminococcus sp.]|nr:GtrA family protein [Ruminococcus sp.]